MRLDNVLLTLVITVLVLGFLGYRLMWQGTYRRRSFSNPLSLDDLLNSLQRTKRTIETALERRQIPLDQVEKAAKMQENLLEMIHRLQNEDRLDAISLNSAMYIATEISLILDRKPLEEGPTHHCYFCSRPYRGAQLLAKLRQAGQETQVITCSICLDQIRKGGRAKVLHFRGADGKSIHWTQYKDFLPNSSYWNINSDIRTSSQKLGYLALVKDDDIN